MDPDDVTLTVNGAALSGWVDVRVTRRLEGCPNDFAVSLTERFPGEIDAFVVQAGDPVIVAIGGDTVLTGYVDRVSRSYDAHRHQISIAGRGKTQDLVDCAAELPSGQITGTPLSVAQALAAPYGITVTSLSGDGPQIPQLNLNLGETAFEIIERLCRYAGLLAYEDTDGNLVLATTQDVQAASGFVEGVNVEAARVETAMDQRFSEYDSYLLSMDVLADAGQGGNQVGSAKDPFVRRHRKMALIVEAGGGGLDVAKQRILWEAARRAGRSTPALITCDSWRDSDGTLWAPNTQAPISLPTLKLDGVTWTIGEVTYRRGDDGQHAEVVLMLPSAFAPQPILLQPVFADVAPGPPT